MSVGLVRLSDADRPLVPYGTCYAEVAALVERYGMAPLLNALATRERALAEECKGRLELGEAADHGLLAAGLRAVCGSTP
jgi:hypothetical protein